MATPPSPNTTLATRSLILGTFSLDGPRVSQLSDFLCLYGHRSLSFARAFPPTTGPFLLIRRPLLSK